MVDYIENILDYMLEGYEGKVTSPSANNIFEVNENGTPLDPNSNDLYHRFMARLLYLEKRARPDILPEIAYLTTRIKEPNADNQKKRIKIMKYIWATKYMPLNLEADGSGQIQWWVDVAFDIYPTIRSHMCGMMSLVKGAAVSASKKKKYTDFLGEVFP